MPPLPSLNARAPTAHPSVRATCRLFTIFDFLADEHKVQKVDTAGDCYIAVGGISGFKDEAFSQVSGTDEGMNE